MAPPLQPERDLAEQAVLRAAVLTKRVLSGVQEISKADASPVTVADFAAQALIIGAIHGAFPEDAFVGEEDAAVLRKDPALSERVFRLVSSIVSQHRAGPEHGSALAGPSSEAEMLDLIDLGGRGQGGRGGRCWVMDPVDGTATFLRGEQYAVSLALLQDGREMLGVLCCPNLRLEDSRVCESSVDDEGLGVMLTAVRGQGSTVRTLSTGDSLPPSRPLERLAAPANLAYLHVVDCLASKSSRHDIVPQLAKRFGAHYPGTDIWSSHVRYVALMLGGGDVLLRVPLDPTSKSYVWDHAGAQLIYTEMGGKVTDLDGKPTEFGAGRTLNQNHGLVAAQEDIHDRVLQLAKELIRKGVD